MPFLQGEEYLPGKGGGIFKTGTDGISSAVPSDRWGAVQMVQNLEGLGFTVIPFGQGFKDMSPPSKELMKLTLEQKSHTEDIRCCSV